jgi:hypothetical protein
MVKSHVIHYFVTQIWVANHRLINTVLKQDLPVSRTGHEGPEWEEMYSSTLSLTSELDGGWYLFYTKKQIV